MSKAKRNSATDAFSLIELLLAIGLVVLLAGLILPTLGGVRDRANNSVCAANLRQIAVAIQQVAQDNNNTFPIIESNPANPVYPPEAGAKSLAEVLKPYGFTPNNLRCPTDVKRQNYFASTGSSYEWFPLVDGETSFNPQIYLSSGILVLPPSKLPLAADFQSLHAGCKNVLFADGHVQAY